MVEAQTSDGYLSFGSLDVAGGLEAAYAVGYRLLDQPDDVWTERFVQFKEGPPSAAEAGIRLVGRMARRILSARGIKPRDVTFIPALTSLETFADANGKLSRAAKHSAEILGAHYRHDLLSKRPHISLHGENLSRQERQHTVAGADFQCRGSVGSHLILVDDFITTGSTLQQWTSAIRVSNPECVVLAMSLAKNERRSFEPKASNGHLDSEMDATWRKYGQ